MPGSIKGMTGEEYSAFLAKHKLRQADGAWLCGQTGRSGHNWVKEGVPIAASLILRAYDEGLLPIEWFSQHVPLPVPP